MVLRDGWGLFKGLGDAREVAGQNFLHDPPQFLSVQPCCVMRLLDPGLRQRPLDRQ